MPAETFNISSLHPCVYLLIVQHILPERLEQHLGRQGQTEILSADQLTPLTGCNIPNGQPWPPDRKKFTMSITRRSTPSSFPSERLRLVSDCQTTAPH